MSRSKNTATPVQQSKIKKTKAKGAKAPNCPPSDANQELRTARNKRLRIEKEARKQLKAKEKKQTKEMKKQYLLPMADWVRSVTAS